MCNRLWRAIRKSLRAAAVIVLAATGAAAGSGVRAADTVKIGFRPLTGPLASNGKAILTAYQMWQEDINAKGDLPVARAQNNFDILRKNFKMRQGAVRLKRRLSRYLIIR
jgi:hypothetical protein